MGKQEPSPRPIQLPSKQGSDASPLMNSGTATERTGSPFRLGIIQSDLDPTASNIAKSVRDGEVENEVLQCVRYGVRRCGEVP
jgi:hypothetical protein